MAEIKQLQMDGVDILPVTHESAVVDNNGTTISAKYQPKSDSSLTTSVKTVVGAINEISGQKMELGSQLTTVNSIKVCYVKYNGANIYPMSHVNGILDSSGNAIASTIDSLKTSIGTTLPNKVSTLETNYTSVKSTSDTLKSTASTLSTSVGTLSSLNTTAKGNLVAAINEVFQLGNSARSRLAAALIAKGCEEITASSSLEDILTVIESESVYNAGEGWNVTQVSGASYGFVYVSGNPSYWESNNKGKGNSYAICQLNIRNPKGKKVTLYYWCQGESGYDYGCISGRNVTLSLSTTIDGSFTMNNTSGYATYSLGTFAESTYQIKYRKDGSVDSGNDSIRFYVVFG